MQVQGLTLWRWHFGWSWEQIERKFEELERDDWKPDAIYITCLMTFWWEATRDLVSRLRKRFPRSRIILGGVYASLFPDHVRRNIPGVVVDIETGILAKRYPPDLSLYSDPPHFSGILLQRSRSANQIVDEIEAKSDLGVREFAFFENQIPGEKPNHFENVLDLIIARGLTVRLVALGNLPPAALTKNLVTKMRRAGFRQIFLQDSEASPSALDDYLGAYERCMDILLAYGGFRPRTGDVTAMALVGTPGENLEQVAARLTYLTHIVGSINLVPYQPTPGTRAFERYGHYLPVELEKQNGKLFPFARLNFATFSDYQELTRLAALLNSKYRSTTFDFLGDGEVGKMVRKSIAEETWRPRLGESVPLLPKQEGL